MLNYISHDESEADMIDNEIAVFDTSGGSESCACRSTKVGILCFKKQFMRCHRATQLEAITAYLVAVSKYTCTFRDPVPTASVIFVMTVTTFTRLKSLIGFNNIYSYKTDQS